MKPTRATQFILHVEAMLYELTHHRPVHIAFHVTGMIRAIRGT